MDTTLVVDDGNVNSQIEQITSWLDEHLAHGQHDSDFLMIWLANTTYRVFNTEPAIERFKKCVRRLRYRSSGKVYKKFPDVRRLQPQGAKFWLKEIAALQNSKPGSEYAGISEEDRATLIAMATKNQKIIEETPKETT